jgi:hypothetical protein
MAAGVQMAADAQMAAGVNGPPGCVKIRKTVIAGLTRNLLTCSFQILSLAFGDLRMTVYGVFAQAAAGAAAAGQQGCICPCAILVACKYQTRDQEHQCPHP